MLSMKGSSQPSPDLMRSIATAVLEQCTQSSAGLELSKTSQASSQEISSASAVASSQPQSSHKRTSVLLMVILAVMECYLPPQSTAPIHLTPPLALVNAFVQSCCSSAGLADLDCCSGMEVRFMLGALVRQFGSVSEALAATAATPSPQV